MAYSYDPIFAADPSNAANVASNASVLIYNPADATKAPVTITDLSGSPLPNPITVNKNGFGPAFQHATLDRLAWSGGGFSNFFTSYEGMKSEAVAARTAAETAAANAAVAAAEGVAPVVAEAEAAAAAAEAAAADTALAVGAVVTTAAVNGAGRLILTKANATTVDAGSVIGPKGDQGVQGLPGVNAVANDTATAGYINDAASQTKAALSATYAPLGLPDFPVVRYGAVDTTGAADSSAAINAAITAAYNAKGGRIIFPKGHIRWDSSPTLPHGASGGDVKNPNVGYQPPMEFIGAGSVRGSLWGTGMEQKTPGSSTVLQMGATTGPAQIDTRGTGILKIRNITFYDPNPTAPKPFIQTTNTLLHIDDVSFFGSPQAENEACKKDAIVFGGTVAPSGADPDSTATSFFQGYGSDIANVYFARIRCGFRYQSAANSILVRNPVWAINCGSDATSAAVVLQGGSLDGLGNTFLNPVFEMSHYVYGVILGPNGSNTFISPNFYDVGAGAVSGFRLVGGSARNTAVGGFYSFATADKYVSSDGNAGNRMSLQYGNGFYQAVSALEGLTVSKTATMDKAVLAGTGADQFFLTDATPTDSAVIARFGSAAGGQWQIRNAGVGTSRRLFVGVGPDGVDRITLEARSAGNVTLNAVNIATDTTTGTKIGTATTQKLGFYGATPVVRPALTYSRTGESTAEAQLRATLVALGLVTDSTVA